MPFADRRDAGRQLARLALEHRGPDTIVLGLARGGMPVAFEVARALGASLDVFVARKLGAPHQPEFGIGAIAPGVRVVDARSAALVGASQEDIDQIAADEQAEMERRYLAYRGEASPPDVRGKTVVLVDDGLATGVTARAAIRSLRRQQPRRLVLAVPVAASETAEAIHPEVDALVVVETPLDFRAVGVWYDDFSQTSDDEVVSLLDEARAGRAATREVEIVTDGKTLLANLALPARARPLGLIVFAHGSGSSRFSPRNRHVASRLQREGFATLLLDLLTRGEEEIDDRTRALRFDIPLLAARLVAAIDRAESVDASTRALPIGAFGASTGAAAALIAAAERSGVVRAVVSRGGRPDLAGDAALSRVRAATLCIVGSEDRDVVELNQAALAKMTCETSLAIVPGATHLFEEPGTLDQAADLAAAWFARHLAGSPRRAETRSKTS